MGKSAVLSVKILGDASGAAKAAAETKQEISGIEKAASASKKALGLAGAAGGAALMAGLSEAITQDGETRKVAASLGLNASDMEAAGKLAGSLYASNYGQSMEQVNETIASVGSTLTTMSANGGADVERLSKKALDLSAAFGVEVPEAVNSAGILMKTGLAKDGDEAMDLLVGSMQKVPKAMQGELLPVMDEYSTHFAALGFDGTTAFGIMSAAAEGGAIQMDKTGDALKEFTIRATDGSKTTADALGTIGLDAQKMANDILAGGSTAQGAMSEIVNGLTGIEDPAAQAQAAIALFGTPLEDLGTDKIPDFLNMVDPMGDAFGSMAGAADEMGKTLNEGPAAALETFKRTASGAFTELAAKALPVLTPMLNTLTQYAPILAPIALGLAGMAALVYGVSGAMAVWNAVQSIGRGVIVATTAAQWLLNAALTANPIGIVIVVIAALVAAVVLAYNNMGWFKDAVNAAWAKIQIVVGAVVDWFMNTALPYLKRVWDAMGLAAKLLYEQFIKPAFDRVRAIVENVIGFVSNIVNAGMALVRGDFSGAMEFLKSAVGNGLEIVRAYFGDLPGKILGALGNLGNLLLNHGAGILQGFLDGLLRKWSEVQSFVGGIASWIANNKGPISYDKKLLRPAGTAIMAGLVSSMKAGMPELTRFLHGVTDTIGGLGSDVGDVRFGAAAARLGNTGNRAGAPAGAGVNITLNVDGGATPEETGKRLIRVLKEELRRNGVVLNGAEPAW